MEYFNVPQDEDTVESDTSEADLFDEEAATMRQLYNAAEADFEGDSSLDIGAGDSTGGAGTGTVISGSIKQMIEQFYATHSDELFECPASGLLLTVERLEGQGYIQLAIASWRYEAQWH